MNRLSRFIVVYVLLGLTGIFIYTHENQSIPVNEPLSKIAKNFGEWTMVKQSRFDPQVLERLKPSDYLYRVYSDTNGNNATLYIGYHDGGPESGPIHSPKHCLPGSGWLELSEEKQVFETPDKQLPVVQAVYQNNEQKELFVYFFQVKGKILVNEYTLKFAEIINSILYNRRDSAFVRISVQNKDNPVEAADIAQRFLTQVYPHISSVLPL